MATYWFLIPVPKVRFLPRASLYICNEICRYSLIGRMTGYEPVDIGFDSRWRFFMWVYVAMVAYRFPSPVIEFRLLLNPSFDSSVGRALDLYFLLKIKLSRGREFDFPSKLTQIHIRSPKSEVIFPKVYFYHGCFIFEYEFVCLSL